MPMEVDRRQFLQLAGANVAALALGPIGAAAPGRNEEVDGPVDSFVFTEAADQRGCNWSTWKMEVNWADVTAQRPTTRPHWGDPPTVFHGNISTFAFADGHVESHTWLEATTLKVAWEMATGKHANIDYAGFADAGDKDRDLRWIYSK